MKQYIDLLTQIKNKGTQKGIARDNMPTTASIFGYQFRHSFADGFPLITTRPIAWRGVVMELIWFLRGDTNIKFLDEQRVYYMWHEDAYNYYLKIAKANDSDVNVILQPISLAKNTRNPLPEDIDSYSIMTFEEFCKRIRETPRAELPTYRDYYTLGSCGKQYGWLWRHWEAGTDDTLGNWYPLGKGNCGYVDQLQDLINGIRTNPFGRRHIMTAWNPTTLNDMALTACHALVQFNCRPISDYEKLCNQYGEQEANDLVDKNLEAEALEDYCGPEYFLDCQLYQRSADVVLGVPYNIASYALLTQIIAEMVGMVPGEFIHTFGDVHIYSNHNDAVVEQLEREPKELPFLTFSDDFKDRLVKYTTGDVYKFSEFISLLNINDFKINQYSPHPKLKSDTTLSTGLK